MQLKLGKDLKGNYYGPMLNMLNRHGLISGATGTGKTFTLKLLTELLSEQGIPTFVVDIKGDLNGFEFKGKSGEKLNERLLKIEEPLPEFQAYPVQYWDLFGVKGLPVRTTISNMGPMLISRLLDLNEIQTSILHTIFKLADDQGLLLLDFKDLEAVVDYVYNNLATLPSDYAGINKSSLSAIIRQMNYFEQQNAAGFFGESELDIKDFEHTENGKGTINLLDATQLFSNAKLYSTFLLWLLSELYEQYEEIGDVEQPKMVFFFDEAHLIFDKIPKILLDQIEQVIRLIRSKGIGIYFITQSPNDLPDSVLSQLGNRVQHGLRAYTAKEIKALKLAAQGFRVNPELELEKVLLELGTGEAVVSFLDENGTPEISNKVFILSPKSQFGHVDGVAVFKGDALETKYKVLLDRESAYEKLSLRATSSPLTDQTNSEDNPVPAKQTSVKTTSSKSVKSDKPIGNSTGKRGRPADTVMEKAAKSFMSSVARSIGSSLARGLMGILKRGAK